MHLAGRMTLEGFLEKHKDGFVMPDYHGGFHWHIFNVLRYGFPFESKSNDFGRFILKGDRIVDGYQRLVVIAMHLKAFSAISPEFFSSIIRAENFFSRQAWKVVNRAGNGLLVNELEKVLKAKLTVYELDDYDDEEDIYWKLKAGETGNTEIRTDSHPYYYMEIHPYWITNNSDSPATDDYLFRLLTPEEFEKLRIPSVNDR